MNIDWSEAPEMATHCYPGSPEPWRDLSGENWKYYKHGRWTEMPNTSSLFLESSLGITLFERPAQPVWSGEGLPPVGTVCELWIRADDWSKCQVIAMDEQDGQPVSVVRYGGGYYAGTNKCLRPICTAKQKAEQARIASAYSMCAVAPSLSNVDALALYDAGFKKFEIVDGEL